MGPEWAQLTTKHIWAISGQETVKILYELYKAELMPSQEVPSSAESGVTDTQHVEVRRKFRQLDPKSQADLDARALIPNALTSKDEFSAMFQGYKALSSKRTKDCDGMEIGKVYDVLMDTEEKMQFVRQEMPEWGDAHVRLGAAGIHLYNRRLSDLSERDYVQVLWMCCGQDLLRVHQGGELFVYQPHLGYWRTFEGLPPPHLFEVVRQFFILL